MNPPALNNHAKHKAVITWGVMFEVDGPMDCLNNELLNQTFSVNCFSTNPFTDIAFCLDWILFPVKPCFVFFLVSSSSVSQEIFLPFNFVSLFSSASPKTNPSTIPIFIFLIFLHLAFIPQMFIMWKRDAFTVCCDIADLSPTLVFRHVDKTFRTTSFIPSLHRQQREKATRFLLNVRKIFRVSLETED